MIWNLWMRAVSRSCPGSRTPWRLSNCTLPEAKVLSRALFRSLKLVAQQPLLVASILVVRKLPTLGHEFLTRFRNTAALVAPCGVAHVHTCHCR